MKNNLVRWLRGTAPEDVVRYLLTEMARAVEAVRPERSYPRNKKPQKLQDFHGTMKRSR